MGAVHARRDAQDARETRTPIRGVRRETAAAMVASAAAAPHVTEFLTVDVTESVRLLERLAHSGRVRRPARTPLTLVAKALLLTLRAHPSLNSAWDEAAQEIVTKHYVNLGIATATERGLMVPNVKDADRLPLSELCRAIGALTDTARAGGRRRPTSPRNDHDHQRRRLRHRHRHPILNPGEAAILALGAITRRPWVGGDDIVARDVTTLGLTVDHRLVDGEQASRFLADLGATLHDPSPASSPCSELAPPIRPSLALTRSARELKGPFSSCQRTKGPFSCARDSVQRERGHPDPAPAPPDRRPRRDLRCVRHQRFLLAMWVVHIPAIEDRTNIAHSTLGSLLLLLALGAIAGMQLAGAARRRYGSRLLVALSGTLLSIAVIGPGLASTAWQLGLALLAFGFGNGALDVS